MRTIFLAMALLSAGPASTHNGTACACGAGNGGSKHGVDSKTAADYAAYLDASINEQNAKMKAYNSGALPSMDGVSGHLKDMAQDKLQDQGKDLVKDQIKRKIAALLTSIGITIAVPEIALPVIVLRIAGEALDDILSPTPVATSQQEQVLAAMHDAIAKRQNAEQQLMADPGGPQLLAPVPPPTRYTMPPSGPTIAHR